MHIPTAYAQIGRADRTFNAIPRIYPLVVMLVSDRLDNLQIGPGEEEEGGHYSFKGCERRFYRTGGHGRSPEGVVPRQVAHVAAHSSPSTPSSLTRRQQIYLKLHLPLICFSCALPVPRAA